jgi:DNA polymerase III delta prime subunit
MLNENQLILKKYQPLRFNEFIINKKMTELFNVFITMDNLNLLLIGNPGCGKTTNIEAIIKEYYQIDKIPRENLLYINNLQDQGIQYYRTEVKNFCQIKGSVKNKKKFLILDNLDTINEQSQQVFRNYIDKYSHNVFFIASCTYKQKVIDSIQSRLTIIKLNNITNDDLVEIFDYIKDKENIKITKAAKMILLNICDYSIRKLLSYIEKFKLYNTKIDMKNIKLVCNNISFHDFEIYTDALLENNREKAIQTINYLYDGGYSVLDIFDNYFTYIKYDEQLNEISKYKLIKLICKYISIFHTIHEHKIELIMFTNNAIQLFNKK